ncbi:MAG TPA: SAM-dependent DNA methyltransferase [Rhodocyclaceae bacterium]|nr:SAM-dependent DNA methyltransferase [Rhodocyclaceae bacterium]
MNAHPAVRIEGGLLGPDTLEQLLAAQLPGQRPADFGLSPRRTLTEEIAAVFSDARALWQVFRRRLERLPEGVSATSETRELWMVPFLRLLDYELRNSSRAREVDGLTFAVSHYAGEEDQAPPVHLVGYRQELGRLAPRSRPRLSPHALVQEYLNRSEALWGLVSNGRTLRLLRDSTFVRRQAYVEFDLEAILEEERFADFVLLYRLLHRTRLPQKERAEECLLEQYYQQSIEQGGRVREHLREGVEQAIEILANGFLGRPASAALRDWVRQAGELAFYRQLLRLIYRLLFLLVAEERGLMGGDPLYRQGYSITRLRGLTEQRAAWTDDADLWHGLRALWQVLTDEKLAPLLGVPPLNGELFAPQELDDAVITNRDLLGALWHLAFYDSPPRRVNYAALDTEELGSVYESLLDYHPTVTFNATGKPHFELTLGSERKSTGSYYTPPQLVSELIRSALEPVIAERLQKAGDPEQALLSIKVCDPACGSGHFLLAAARRLGKELARIRSGEDEPAPEQIRAAIREVVAHCIYGVDKNPLAVELARVALWLESHAEGKPLTFLEHRIKCGDSLVGVFDLEVLKDGLPDDAFTPLQGDDKKTAASVKRQNKAEREGQMTLFGWNLDLRLDSLAALAQEVDAIPDDSPAAVRRKRDRYEARAQDPAWQRQKAACDLWTAAFFQRLSPALSRSSSPAPLTTDAVRRALAGQAVSPQTLAEAQALAAEVNFFHWPLEFPEVFAERKEARAREDEAHVLPRSTSPALSKGFDVLLANPPWERIKLQEQEFFAERDARIAGAPNAAARKRLIERLPQENPALWADYRRALHTAESASRFLRSSGAYPLTGRGDINTYSVFAERIRQLIASDGRAGVIVPTGIATDATNQYFFADLVEEGQIVSLFDFENREGIFPGVHRSYKFSLLTLGGFSRSPALPLSSALTLSFFATRADHLRDPRRVFTLSAADIARINPNTRTLPVFRTRQDAELTSAIYRRVPVLVDEASDENPWGVRFLAMFHMSNDSHLFRTRAELEAQGWRLEGNRFLRGGETCLPLYEAKMIWHYDHRFGAYEGVTDRTSTQLPTPDDRQHADPHFLALPWYWVDAAEVGARLGAWTRGWLLGFRNVTNATNERSAIFSLSPLAGVGNSLPILLPDEASTEVACLVGNLSALVFDWVARQKLAGVNMNFFYVQQFPVLPPAAYTPERLRFIVPRVLELTYTAWDLAPFAADLWHDADASLRAAMQAQWQANQAPSPALSLSRSPAPPFPPFRWDEARRALLRAELDAYYARLYGLTRKQLRYLLDPADLTARELEDILDPWEEVADPLDPQGYAERVAASDFPGETFRVLKEKEIRAYGEYRTRRLVLEAWEVV